MSGVLGIIISGGGISTPSAPTIGTATRASSQTVDVTFTAPVSDGGSPITSYTVVSSPGNITVTGTTSPFRISGLSNTVAYTFTVYATNSIGNGISSSASNSVTPYTIPGAPTIGTVTAGNGQATIPFTAPASNGGSAITSYTVTSSPGGITATGSTSPITITGLSNGTGYTFTVYATNAAGNSDLSSTSNGVIPFTVPGAPTIGTATVASATSISVAFTAPASDGGSAITSYTAVSSPGNITATGTTSPITVSGLTTGTAYTFTVYATNAAGNGSSSGSSNSVTPVRPSVVASGGTISSGTGAYAGYRFHTFTSPGTFRVPSNLGGQPFALIIVGGGGAGGLQTSYGGSGGGGGGVGDVPDIGVLASGSTHQVIIGSGASGSASAVPIYAIQNAATSSYFVMDTHINGAYVPGGFNPGYEATGGGTGIVNIPGWAPGSGGSQDGAYSGTAFFRPDRSGAAYPIGSDTRGEGTQLQRGLSNQTKGGGGGGAQNNPEGWDPSTYQYGVVGYGTPGAGGLLCPVNGQKYGGGGGGSKSPVAPAPTTNGTGGAGGGSPGGGTSPVQYKGTDGFGGGGGGGTWLSPAPARNGGGSGRVVIRYPYP